MITGRKVSQINVFAGSPWEVASIKNRLNAAYIQVSMQDKGVKGIQLMVPCEYYSAAIRVINNKIS